MKAPLYTQILLSVLLTALLPACTAPIPAAPPTLVPTLIPPASPTQVKEMVDSQPATGEPSEGWIRSSFPNLGVSFEVPAAWQANQDFTWTPPDSVQARLGVLWAEPQPGLEVEAAFFPPNSVVRETVIAEVAGLAGRQYTLELYGAPSLSSSQKPPVLEIQTHVIVPRQGGLVYDFYAAGHTLEEMFGALDELEHLLESVEWE